MKSYYIVLLICFTLFLNGVKCDTNVAEDDPDMVLPEYPDMVLPEGNRTVLAVTSSKYGVQVVALGKDWYLHQKYQLPNGSWSEWYMIPHPPNMTFESDPACCANLDGRVECCARGHETLALWCFHQTDASKPTSWSKGLQLMLGGQYSFPTNNVNLQLGTDGRMVIYLRGFDGMLYTAKQVSPGSSAHWNPVHNMGVLME